MILVRISGGLGNQLFQYALGIALAKHYKTELKVDVEFYSKQDLRTFDLAAFELELNIATKTDIFLIRGLDNRLVRLIETRTKNRFKRKGYYKETKNPTFEREVFDLEGNLYFDGFWQSEKYFKDNSNSIREMFTPKQKYLTSIKGSIKEISNSQSVSVHIRRGDYVSDKHTNSVHGVCSIEYYLKAMDLVTDKRTDAVFYVFSDDIEWCKNNLKNKNIVYVDWTDSNIQDLYLMSLCKDNIIANSSFSWWGAWLNKNENKIVVAPKRWLNDDLDKRKWVPDEWVTV